MEKSKSDRATPNHDGNGRAGDADNEDSGPLLLGEERVQRIQEVVQEMGRLEAELEELTGGQLDAVIRQDATPVFLYQAHHNLVESERRFRAIFDAAGDAMLLFDHAGQCVEANAAAHALFPCPDGRLVGKRMNGYVDIAAASQLWGDLQDTGMASGELDVRLPDGSVRKVVVFGVAEILPGQSLWTLHDVTEQKAAEEAVLHSRELQRKMLDALPANIALVDPDGVVVAVNDGWRQFAEQYGGRDPDASVGRNYLAICEAAIDAGEEDAAAALTGLHAILSGQSQTLDIEYAMDMREAGVRWYRLVAGPVPIGRGTGAVLMHVDISTRVAAERAQEESMQERSELVSALQMLLQTGNHLSRTASVYELCREAVQLGREQLGFDRMSIWLVEPDREHMHGTYGVDERGHLRDERHQRFSLEQDVAMRHLMADPHASLHFDDRPLYDDESNVVGYGESVAAAVWNGEEAVGMVCVDNLFSHLPITENQQHVLELYAASLGHLLSLKQTEHALRSNEDLLRRVLDNLPIGVAILDADGKMVSHNPAISTIWGSATPKAGSWRHAEARWLHDGRRVQPEEATSRRVLRTKRAILNDEFLLTYADRSNRIVSNSAIPMMDDEQRLAGLIIVTQDITDQKQHEHELAALASLTTALRPQTARQGVVGTILAQFAELLPTRGVSLILRGGDGMQYTEAALGALAPTRGARAGMPPRPTVAPGATAPQVLSRGQIWQPDAWDGIDVGVAYLVEAPLIVQGARVGAIVYGCDSPPIPGTMSLVQRLADAAAAALHQTLLHEEVETQARRLQRVMDSVNLGLLLLDRQHRIILGNHLAMDVVGKDGDVQVGDELLRIGGQRVRRLLETAARQDKSQELNLDGRIFELSSAPVAASGDEEGWLVMLRDVTIDRQIQRTIQQHERLAAVGQLAAGIAHDFNNIIAVILLYVQMLRRSEAFEGSDLNRLQVIQEQAQHASQLIRQVLDFSRQSSVERRPLNPAPLLKEVIKLWERTLPEHMAFELQAPETYDLHTSLDPALFQQALTNLAVNARDAMPQGGRLTVTLNEVTVEPGEEPPVSEMPPGTWVAIAITDSGDGIEPENLAHIFEPFFTTKPVGQGTGLGLAQVYGIVKQHHGFVDADSKPGEGTTVRIYLPALDAPGAAEDEAYAPAESIETGSETVLLVEDNESAREATAAILEMMGYRVLLAADGRQGLDRFMEDPAAIHLVVSDLVMPEMGGLELYQHMREAKSALRMLIMSGYSIEDQLDTLAEVEIVDWLQKPFTVKELTAKVRYVLDREIVD